LLVLQKRKQEALGLAELLTDPAKKVRVLLHIAEQLREQANEEAEWLELLMRASDVARTIDKFVYSRTLEKLSNALVQAQQWAEAERVISMIQDSSEQAEA